MVHLTIGGAGGLEPFTDVDEAYAALRAVVEGHH